MSAYATRSGEKLLGGRSEAFLLAVLALWIKPSRSNSAVCGDCLYNCEGSTCADFGNHSSMCQELRAKCLARCSGKKSWGSIAYSPPDQQFGYSLDWNNVNDAKKDALARCNKTGKACKVWIYYENECGAIAADGNTVTWGTAYLRANAEQRALLECRKSGGKNCAIRVWGCSKM
jgi:uncharacterized protein DUF4189